LHGANIVFSINLSRGLTASSFWNTVQPMTYAGDTEMTAYREYDGPPVEDYSPPAMYVRELTAAEADLMVGLLCTFVLDMHRLKRNPDLTPRGREEYEESIRLAETAKFKLLGVE